MSGHRIDKVNEEIKKELSYIIPKLKDPRIPDFVTVTEVRTSPDLKTAKVYFSSINGDENEVLAGLRSSAGFARGLLSKAMKIRYTPELIFMIDTSVKYGMFINEKLAELGLSGSGEDDEQS